MEFIRVRRNKSWIRLDKGEEFRYPMALQMPMWPWHGLRWAVGCFPSFGESGSFPQHRQSFGVHFLIVFLAYGFEVLVRDSSCG
jgi:hypothetical protein